VRLTTADGIEIVLPAGVADGDEISVDAGHFRAVLTVRVNLTRRT
jgi:hypothetical protein